MWIYDVRVTREVDPGNAGIWERRVSVCRVAKLRRSRNRVEVLCEAARVYRWHGRVIAVEVTAERKQ